MNATAFAPRRWVIMGVSGTGKSAVGRLLASRLDAAYVEGDDDHPLENIRKMASGQPLTDTDRHAWLLILKERLRHAYEDDRPMVLACSALKRRYRDLLRQADPNLIFVHLHGERDLIESRMRSRERHFMPASMLDSQLEDLEPPEADEKAIPLNVIDSPETLVEQAISGAQGI